MKKVGLVGCGRISKRHIEAISATEGIEIACVCDINEEKAKAASELLGVPYVTDYRELNGKGLDVISVLTPSGWHPRHVCDIAEATDAPYIVCEKPLSLTVREAFEVYRRLEKAGKTLLPVFQNRYNPLVKMMNDLNRDALTYWKELGLTAASLKKINEAAIKGGSELSALDKALMELGG